MDTTPAARSPVADDNLSRSTASHVPESPVSDAQTAQISTLKDSPWKKISGTQAPIPSVHINGGVARASIPDDVLYGSTPLWNDCIVGYFIDEPPHVGKIHAAINRWWRTKKQAETKGTMIAVDFLNPTTALFRIPNKHTRDFILGKHVWHIGTTPMVVQQWSPTKAKSAPDMTKIPVWVDFTGVPDNLYATKGLKFLGDIVGKYQSLDPKTEKCLNLEVARVMALVNFEQELVHTIDLTGTDGEEIKVNVSYPWVPLKCETCVQWGHSTAKCPSTAHEAENKIAETNTAAETTMQPGQSTSPVHNVRTHTESPPKDGSEDRNQETIEESHEATEAGWSKVPGGKSPNKHHTSPRAAAIHTPIDNPFNVLQTEEQEEGEIEEENDQVTADDTEAGPAKNVGVADDNGKPIENVTDEQDDEEGKKRFPGSTRGRRGRPRKNATTTTHSEFAAPNNKKQGYGSVSKH